MHSVSACVWSSGFSTGRMASAAWMAVSKGRGGRNGVERAGKSQVLRGLAGHGDGVWLSC